MPYDIIVTAPKGVNKRERADANSKKLGSYPKGTQLRCDKKDVQSGATWYHVDKQNHWVCGYLKSDGWYIKDANSKPSTSNPSKPVPETSNKPTGDTTPDYSGIDNILSGKKEFDDSATVSYYKAESEGVYDAQTLSKITNDFSFPVFHAHKEGDDVYDYSINTNWLNNYIRTIKRNMNIYTETHDDLVGHLFSHFNRFKIAFPDVNLDKTFCYVFFTRPNLNLLDSPTTLNKQASLDPTIYYINQTRPELIKVLTKNYTRMHDFNPYLSNTNASFEISDESITTHESSESLTGHKVVYGKHNLASKTAGTFSINFTDDKEFNIYKMHKVWTDYISKVYRGEFKPRRSDIHEKTLDYACSVYFILCGADGETVLFWSKYYGVFPHNTPSSTTSWTKGNLIKNPEYSITYSYSFKEDFNPLALAEFNMNSVQDKYIYRKIYEPNLLTTGRTFTGAPFIDLSQNDFGRYAYKLRFRQVNDF